MTTTAERIRECRTNAGLSQAELSSLLSVSRQAVSKWDSGAGLPDIGTLKTMAALFDVSVDYLIANESDAAGGEVLLRQPIDLATYEPHRQPGKPLGSRHHAAVLAAYPQARVWTLSRRRTNTGVQEALEWLTSLFGLFGTADALQNHDAYYLVETPTRQLVVRVGRHELTSQELRERVTARSFSVGHDAFRRTGEVQRG